MAEEKNPEDSRPGGFAGVELIEVPDRVRANRKKERDEFMAEVTAAILEELAEYEDRLAELVKNRG